MGVIIFTTDDTQYRTGDYFVMYGQMTISPTQPNTTYIFHTDKFTESDALYWAQVVPHRMVVVSSKMPRLTKKSDDCVIVDQRSRVAKEDFSRKMRAALCWADRDRAHSALSPIPLALANAFIKVNVNDIGFGRLLARCKFTLHDSYTRAAIAYGIVPVRGFKWPPKSKRSDYILPSGMRRTDKHLDIIVNNDIVVTNEIRINDNQALPKGQNKTQQKVIQWI